MKEPICFIIVSMFLMSSFHLAGQTHTIVETDSSTITIRFNESSDTYRHSNKLHDRPDCYCTEFYGDHKTIRKTGKRYYDSNVGKWDYFTNKGVKYMTIDYANIARELCDTIFVFDDYWRGIREKADSIVRSYYSADFFDAHIKLNASQTTWHVRKYEGYSSGSWFELFEIKPEYFNMAYLIMISPRRGFDYIKFELDGDGNLVESLRNKGLNKIDKCCFNVDMDKINEIIIVTNLEEEAGSEWALEWNDTLKDLQIRITNARFKIDNGKRVLKTRTIYINPWTAEYSDVIENINEIIM